MPQPTGNPNANIPDSLQRFFNPGVESGLGALAGLLGTYESARGVPAGSALQFLGQLGLQNAANRQALTQGNTDVMEHESALASQGLLPSGPNMSDADKQWYTAVFNMDPAAAENAIKERAGEAVKQRDRVANLRPTVKTNQKTGKTYRFDPTTFQPTEIPELSWDPAIANQPKTLYQQYAKEHANDPNLAENFAKFQNRTQEDKYATDLATNWQMKLANAGPLKLTQMQAQYTALGEQSPKMLPQMKGRIIIDKETMQPVNLAKMKILLDNPDKYAVVDQTTARTILPALIDTRTNLLRLSTEAAKILPPDTGSVWKNWINTKLNSWAISAEAIGGGGVTESQFLADRQQMTAQLQRLFTGSTRQMNMVEFNSILGRPVGANDKFRHPGETDIASVLPARNDTREQAASKSQALAQLLDEQMKLNDLSTQVIGGKDGILQHIYDSTPPDTVTLPFSNEGASGGEGTSSDTPAGASDDGTL